MGNWMTWEGNRPFSGSAESDGDDRLLRLRRIAIPSYLPPRTRE